ncbi:MAG: flagellar protein export ATPase FliI [Gammaproteobacteria bacterium]
MSAPGLASRLRPYRARAAALPLPPVEGRLTRLVGLMLEARGCHAAVGDRCMLLSGNGAHTEAEVVGFSGDRLLLMPTGRADGLEPDTRVVPTRRSGAVAVGDAMLGRIVDGAGVPLDGAGPIDCSERRRLGGEIINPLERDPIVAPLDVGVRAINAALTVGRGQRIGLFAGSGVGKSVLLGMMARHTAADVIVVGLIGERGREVKEFVERILGPRDRSRAVVVAAPADAPPLLRIQGAWLATAVAEHFRDQGRSVLLLMDSLTRFAQAQREIGLAVGEAPATKGYPPSVFARLPQLVERAGNGRAGGGSITAFYTVLTEGDDQQDPIADSARAILDGHIVLSRRIAESGHYPAIDIEASISRVMHEVVPQPQWEAARQLRELMSTFNQSRELVNLGAWKPGANPVLDRAVALWPRIQQLLAQRPDERAGYVDSVTELQRLMGES